MNTLYLPEGYVHCRTVDFKNDKKLVFVVSLLAMTAIILLVLLGHLFRPLQLAFSRHNHTQLLCSCSVFLISLFIYSFARQWIHGIFMQHYCGEKSKYGFVGLSMYTGNKNAYFDRRTYITCALMPTVLLGAVLLLLCGICGFFLPPFCFWISYLILIISIIGAVNDLYIVGLLMRMPRDILINDHGMQMHIFTRSKTI